LERQSNRSGRADPAGPRLPDSQGDQATQLKSLRAEPWKPRVNLQNQLVSRRSRDGS
jgi:hypothetical protein